MKKIIGLVLAVLMMASLLSACGKQKPAAEQNANAAQQVADTAEQIANNEEKEISTREFTDDCGRTVTLPTEITRMAISGPLTQIYTLPLELDSGILVGCAAQFSNDLGKYIPESFKDLPELGQLYGGKGTMDKEALLAANPQVVLDVGEAKGDIVSDLDALTEQTGIPFVHIDATTETAPEAYRRIGELIGDSEKTEELAAWCENCLADIKEIMEKVDADGARKTLLYCLGDKGLNVLAEGSYHADTLKLVATNVADIENVVPTGAGNEVDMEQLIIWNPEVIIFEPNSVYSEVGNDAAWQQMQAIALGNYYKTPQGPYGWLQSPPSVQRYLGLLWLTSLLYPEYTDYDLYEKVSEYYELFYDYDMTPEVYNELTADSLPKQ